MGHVGNMTLEQQVLELPPAEKLKLMENIWGSLTKDADRPSPEWHQSVLAETAER